MLRKLKQTDGFTAIEVLISLGILSILFFAAVTMVTISTNTNARALAIQNINEIAFAKIQEYENMEFSDIPIGSPGNDYEVEEFIAEVESKAEKGITINDAKVYNEPISGSLYYLTLNIEYEYGANPSNIEYATYIQLGGAGR